MQRQPLSLLVRPLTFPWWRLLAAASFFCCSGVRIALISLSNLVLRASNFCSITVGRMAVIDIFIDDRFGFRLLVSGQINLIL